MASTTPSRLACLTATSSPSPASWKPKANSMTDLHKQDTILSILQDSGHKVALVTDGGISGASGKVHAAIHVTPEALEGKPIRRAHDDDSPSRPRGRQNLKCWCQPVISRCALPQSTTSPTTDMGHGPRAVRRVPSDSWPRRPWHKRVRNGLCLLSAGIERRRCRAEHTVRWKV